MSFSLSEMWQTMGLPAKIVGAFLLSMGLGSLTVFFERLITLRRARAASKRFAAEVGDAMHAGNIEGVIAQAAKHPHGHLARLVHSALSLYLQARGGKGDSGLTPVERTRRHVERRLEELNGDLRRGLVVLASVGSIAPFVGLLGTVVGIISAFQGIASTGSGGLSSVAAGISEALVETALGLAVAIPAVLAYNYLANAIGRDELALATAGGELIDTVEGWDDTKSPDARSNELRRERVA
jgi:biopolymer transport protein ExbB